MQLTSRQMAVLKIYKRLENTAPTTLRLISLSVISLILPQVVIVAGIAIVTLLEMQNPRPATVLNLIFIGFLIGMGVGTLTRDIGRLRASAQIWPVLNFILDWNKVDELLAENVHLNLTDQDATHYSD